MNLNLVCACGHRKGMHSAGHGEDVYNGPCSNQWEGDWYCGCRCPKFRNDNLRYLESLLK